MQQARSISPIERWNRETKRRADAVKIYLNRDSVARLTDGFLQEQHDEWSYGERRYFSEISMRELIHTLNGQTELAELYIAA